MSSGRSIRCVCGVTDSSETSSAVPWHGYNVLGHKVRHKVSS